MKEFKCSHCEFEEKEEAENIITCSRCSNFSLRKGLKLKKYPKSRSSFSNYVFIPAVIEVENANL